MTIDERDREFSELRREVRTLRAVVGLLGLVLIAVVGTAFRSRDADVLRARGLILVDEAGRDRILIGAPIPQSASRVRTDSIRVAREWSRGFPNPAQYMAWYREYRHTMHGMLVLDERGFDRLAVGDSMPDPNVGRRLGASTGVTINDAHGFERSGYGLMTVNGADRVVLGLDTKTGEEGLTLSVKDGGGARVSVDGGDDGMMFFGVTPPDSALGLRDTTRGILFTRRSRVMHRWTVDAAQAHD